MKNYFKVISITALVFVFWGMVVYGGEEKSSVVKKKVVFVKDDDGEMFKSFSELMNSLLEKDGWTKDKMEYISLSLAGKEGKADSVLEDIKKIKPDVVLINTTLIELIGVKLKKDKIPVVAGGGLEAIDEKGNMRFVDKNGSPSTNLTGTFTMPRAQLKNSFMFLNKVSPIKDKKVVFATYPSAAFTESKVKNALQELKIPVKDYKVFNYIEDYQDFVKKYNEDKEVGWILYGEAISKKKDGSKYSFDEMFKWDRENNKKANLSFWEVGVSGGTLCALAIDSMTTINQMIDMSGRLLKGENLKNIKPEDPKKTLIILNQARAKEIGVEFPIEVMNAAWKIYTDYEGHFVGVK